MSDRRALTRWLLLGAGLAVLLGGGWLAYQSWFAEPPAEQAVKSTGDTILDQAGGINNVETVDVTPDAATLAGTTPMAQRVAVLGLLNKRNGAARELTLKPGESIRVGDVVVRLRACEQTAPWEADHYTGAFVQLDVEQRDHKWRRVFSGWLYKERPSLNVVQHPIYDVWTKSCAMTFPSGGPASVPAAAEAKRSSAKKSAKAAGGDAPPASADSAPAPAAAPAPAPTTPSNAEPSNPR